MFVCMLIKLESIYGNIQTLFSHKVALNFNRSQFVVQDFDMVWVCIIYVLDKSEYSLRCNGIFTT